MSARTIHLLYSKAPSDLVARYRVIGAEHCGEAIELVRTMLLEQDPDLNHGDVDRHGLLLANLEAVQEYAGHFTVTVRRDRPCERCGGCCSA